VPEAVVVPLVERVTMPAVPHAGPDRPATPSIEDLT
jgi:hypothetical protein